MLEGCAGRFDIYSPGEIHRTVRPLESGAFIVSYRWRYVVDAFGPDMTALLKGVREEEMASKWKQAIEIAVPKYLAANGLVPAECSKGVYVTRSGEAEGGGGWAEFRCT